jgi:hypothetical protein
LWEHKKDLIDFSRQETKRKRICVVLENDVLFTGENLDYWFKNRENLRTLGLVPSFLRIEHEKNFGKWICIDVHDLALLEKIEQIEVNNSAYIQLPKLYSGLTVLDDELLKEYVKSKAIQKKEIDLVGSWCSSFYGCAICPDSTRLFGSTCNWS